MRILLCFLGLFLCIFSSISQYKPQNGVKRSKSDVTAIINAHIYASSSLEYENAYMLIQDGRVLKIGKKIKIPKGAVIIDMKGRTILPGFIELSSGIGMPKVNKKERRSFTPQMETSKGESFYWNEAVHPEVNASEMYSSDKKSLENLNKMGFGFVVSHKTDGIVRGSGLLVSTDGEDLSKDILAPEVASFYSLSKGSSRQSYPSSQMGSIALLRQSLYDYAYYSQSDRCFTDLSMRAWEDLMELPKFMETKDKWEIVRAAKIAKEFGIEFLFLGSGNEYECVQSIKELNAKVVIPVTFPKAFDVSDPYISRLIPLSELKHWELAPFNFSILLKEGVELAISSNGCKNEKEFWTYLRKILETGVSKTEVLKALTETPAKFLGKEKSLGSLEKDKLASFTVFNGDPFEDKNAKVNELWLMGKAKVLAPFQDISILGTYTLDVGESDLHMVLTGNKKNPKAFIYELDQGKKVDSTKQKVELKVEGNDVRLTLNRKDTLGVYAEVLKGKVTSNGGVMEGDIVLRNGTWSKWSAIRIKEPETEEKKATIDTLRRGACWYPNLAYGLDSTVHSQSILFRNATVWTNESEGILENTDVLIKDGLITEIGPSIELNDPLVKLIDASGMHLTSGIIDEHSHIAISKGVNESGQAVSAEVSIGDVVNPDDINIYRQLTGGVTCSQLLHGSANPIGGQSAIVKLKWGSTPSEMLVDDAPGFIKFALGENVKQSNWGNFNTVRFPQTRMGVEQVFYDGFYRAKKYREEWENYRKKEGEKNDAIPPRKDLELESLAEILESKRFITCHSYVQSEVNMLMHVADSMGFKVNTFTHILEGYKVADKMKEHGVGGSTFSDWWAYKFEVNDAIPYNASLMHENGVVVAINSDDAEMGRRLNQEAAKGVKYGGMSQEDAWKMVTLNPAKLLHLDHRMGSIKVGKDADLVLWTENPLSIMAKVNKTLIEGAIYYDADAKSEVEKRNQIERARIIQKMLTEKENGKGVKQFKFKKERFYHCDSIGEEGDLKTNMH